MCVFRGGVASLRDCSKKVRTDLLGGTENGLKKRGENEGGGRTEPFRRTEVTPSLLFLKRRASSDWCTLLLVVSLHLTSISSPTPPAVSLSLCLSPLLYSWGL